MIKIYPVRTSLIKPGDDILSILISALSKYKLKQKDIIVVSSKPIYIAYGRIIKLSQIYPNIESREISKKYNINPRYAKIIIEEADVILGGTDNFLLTIKDNILIPNAGIDQKNVETNSVVIPTRKIFDFTKTLYKSIRDSFNVKVGIIIMDSFITPLRLGTRAVAIATYGFMPIKKYVNKRDLYGKKIKFTFQGLADEIASAAHLVIGEGDERIPLAIVRGLNIKLIEKDTTYLTKIELKKDIFRELLIRCPRWKVGFHQSDS